ncbi:MAG: phospholipase D-like domain-containing protein [Nostoc sp. DedQUE05]|uniref:phospholipase D-like domain-containing protein n=1 Tax=Nostoc sp. DedQUE05 TaxID=3075391 RepID=UPI002AD4DF09|nr:phospholipase D-like domain-containing protein [Nostoc sp. DedQUE05]MDZ8092952.1 phospholipase D-like domain-containing protein [Nostoc sp. DedQUE05]
MQLISRPRYFLYIFLLIFSLAGCQRVQSFNQRPAPLPQDPLVRVYFNHSESSEYQEAYRQQTRLGDDLEKQIVDAIVQAKSTVDVAVQELRLPKVAQALADRQKAGVKVRIILENTYSRPWSSLTSAEVGKLDKREQERYNEFRKFIDLNQDNQLSPGEINQRDALIILQNAQIPWLDDRADGSAGSSLMHHKFVIVDNRLVIITSANFTLSDTSGDFTNLSSLGNANNLLQIDSPELAALFTEEFNVMWGDGPGGQPDSQFGLKKPMRLPKVISLGNTKITVQFSPTSPTQLWSNSSNGLIGKTLDSATKSIDMALFVFSEQPLANILEKRHQQSVQIRALIEPQFAYRPYSEALDMMGVALSNKCKYEVDNHPWSNPITTVGVPVLPKGDLLHHKFAVIDSQTVITGSHNWSDAANNGNDETLVTIENPVVAAHYVREFARLYAKVKPGLPPAIQQKIKLEQTRCPQLKKAEGRGQKEQFISLQDLGKVPGVSARTLEKWSVGDSPS